VGKLVSGLKQTSSIKKSFRHVTKEELLGFLSLHLAMRVCENKYAGFQRTFRRYCMTKD
ncbi:unnamed protein product, partial [Larinioides sclopetarius]